jgi:hypothetical protein
VSTPRCGGCVEYVVEPAGRPLLLDALDSVVISSAERSSLTWLAGFEAAIVENIAAWNHPGPAELA